METEDLESCQNSINMNELNNCANEKEMVTDQDKIIVDNESQVIQKKKHAIPQETINFLKMLKKKKKVKVEPKSPPQISPKKKKNALKSDLQVFDGQIQAIKTENDNTLDGSDNIIKNNKDQITLNKLTLPSASLAMLQSDKERKKGEPSVRSVLYKYSQHEDKGWYICPRENCKFKSRHSKNVYTHEKTHTGFRKYCCTLCGKTFILMKNFKLHQAMHNDIRNFPCDLCDKRFRNKNNLERHKLTHTGERPFICTEENCSAAFRDKVNLKKHIALKHRGEKPFKCDTLGCDYVAFDSHSLKRHMMKHKDLQDRPSEICNICGKTLYGLRSMQSHMLIHSGQTQQCPFCVYTTVFKQALLAHSMRKHGMDLEGNIVERKYRCEKCDFSTFWEHDLKFHMVKHGKHRPFKCPICDYSTVLKGSLQKHMRLHTGEQPFMCLLCGKGYTNQSGLARHRRAHTGEKPHQCNICGKKYADLKTLRVHRFSHMNVKPFVCQLCNYTCTKKEVLVTHFRRVHGESMMPEQIRPRPPIRVIMRVTSGQTADEIVHNIAPPGLGERHFMEMNEDTNDEKFMVIHEDEAEFKLDESAISSHQGLIPEESVFRIVQTQDGQTTVDTMNKIDLDDGDKKLNTSDLEDGGKPQLKVMKIATAPRSPVKSTRVHLLNQQIGETPLLNQQNPTAYHFPQQESPSKLNLQTPFTVTGQMASVGALGQKFVIVSGEEASILKSLELDDQPQLIAIPVTQDGGEQDATGALNFQNIIIDSDNVEARNDLANVVAAVKSVENSQSVSNSLMHMTHPILQSELIKSETVDQNLAAVQFDGAPGIDTNDYIHQT